MANMTITTPGGSTTFDVPAEHVTTLLEMAAAHMEGTPTQAEKEAWLRKQFFILMRNRIRVWKQNELRNAAAVGYTDMPITEV